MDGTALKPLASPALEYRMTGAFTLAAGIVLGVAAVAIQKPGPAAFRFLFVAVFFGGFMYLVSYRQLVRKAVTQARHLPDPVTREDPAATRHRAVRKALLLSIFEVILALLFRDAALVGGITAGGGVGLLAASRWIERWEREQGVQVLREPRWRWSRQERWGWGRGRGVMDPQDFYVVRSEGPSR
jgi:hypothetical protein